MPRRRFLSSFLPRPRFLPGLVAVVLVTTTATVLPAASASAVPRSYQATDLGTLAGGEGQAVAVNDRGHAVGWSRVTPNGWWHAVLWRDGNVVDLGLLPGHLWSEAVDINERGEVVGTSSDGEVTRAVLWRNGQMIDLGSLGGVNSAAVAINDRSMVLGLSQLGLNKPNRAIWHNGVWSDLGPEDFYEKTNGFNNRGDVVGTFSVPPYEYPCTCVGGRLRDGVLTRIGGQTSDINNLGQIVGDDFRWRDGVYTRLGSLGGGGTWAARINDLGVVLGRSNTATDDLSHPYLWWAGTMTDLTTRGLLVEDWPMDLNIRGQLVGSRLGRPMLYR